MANAKYTQLLEKTMFATLKNMQLRALRRVNFKFDPFHPNVNSIRNALFHMNSQKVRLTNPSCTMRNEVVSDRSAPQIDIQLTEGQRYRILTENLSTLEIIQQVDRICREFDPKREELET